METVRLGRTDLDVSVVGLGCGGRSRLGMRDGRGEAQATRIVEQAIDRGITIIDTARQYGTETAVGNALRGKRDRVVVSTKSPPVRDDRLLTAAELTAGLEESLDSLGTDYVDVFHLHGVTPEDHPHAVEELLPELQRQRHAGKIRFLGVTEVFDRDTTHRMVRAALLDDYFDVVMVGFNVLNPSARTSVFPLATQHDIGTMIMFAVRRALSQPNALVDLVAGLVTEGVVDPSAVDLADPLAFVREFAEVSSVVEMAYRFCRHEPGAGVILTGTGVAEHLDENIRAILAPPLPGALAERLYRTFGHVDSVSGN